MPTGNTDAASARTFGDWRFEAETGDLAGPSVAMRLEPQVGKLLLYFLDHQHRVISRDELIATVWNNRVVSDDAINRCISILRQSLTPGDKNAYIETVVRKGYLGHFPPPPVATPDPVQAPPRHSRLALAAVLLLAAIAFFYVATKLYTPARVAQGTQRAGPLMLAVLPFSEASMEADSKFIADGLHDDLLTQLAGLQSMRVLSRTSVMAYRDSTLNLRDIGQQLGADAILEGGVQLAAGQVHVNVQLIDARTDAHLWAETYDLELVPAKIFELQSEIARAIAAALDSRLTQQDKAQLERIPTENMAAYRAYHEAMEIRENNQWGVLQTEYLRKLEEAVELDPNYSRAWAELVMHYAYRNTRGDRPELTRSAEQALERLKIIAPDSPELVTGQAAYVYYILRDYDRAHALASRALEMSPGDLRVLELRSWIERRQGDFDAWVDSRRQILKQDPRNRNRIAQLLGALLFTQRYDEAWARLQASSLDDYAISYTRNLLRLRSDGNLGRFQQAMAELCLANPEVRNCGWTAHIATRDYHSALEALDQPLEGLDRVYISLGERQRVFTHWLMGTPVLPEEEARLQAMLEMDKDETGVYMRPLSYIAVALLAGARGDADEAEHHIRRWFHLNPIDWAERTGHRHEACRVLGMLGRAQAAVECIRGGLVEPSSVMPFLEPRLPFYDAVREDPAFVEMLAEPLE